MRWNDVQGLPLVDPNSNIDCNMFGQEEEAAIGRQTEQQTESREPDAGVAPGRGRRATSGTGDNKANEEKRWQQNTEKTETQRSKR